MIPISVIIPVYNVEKYLRRCLDSVINQTFRDLEIICVNDGSTDSSSEILEEYKSKDERIIVINKVNGGLSSARNAGMKVAQGEYIGFVDSDDWIDLDFFEKLYVAAKKHDADAACTGIKRVYSSGKVLKKLDFSEEILLRKCSEKYSYLEIPKKCYVWNKIYKKSEVERQNLLFKEGVTFEDCYFTIRFLYHSDKIVAVPNIYYNYWVNNKSISRITSDKNQMDKIAARADFIKFSREHHIICDEKFYVKDKIFYKLFGILILKIYEWETIKKYYLFGLIPFFEKRISL
jgi:glycosyltransferase involved in cell wall biosynthesis